MGRGVVGMGVADEDGFGGCDGVVGIEPEAEFREVDAVVDELDVEGRHLET